MWGNRGKAGKKRNVNLVKQLIIAQELLESSKPEAEAAREKRQTVTDRQQHIIQSDETEGDSRQSDREHPYLFQAPPCDVSEEEPEVTKSTKPPINFQLPSYPKREKIEFGADAGGQRNKMNKSKIIF